MENSQRRNGKTNELLTHISTKNVTKLNELIYAGAKLISEKKEDE